MVKIKQQMYKQSNVIRKKVKIYITIVTSIKKNITDS